MTYRYKFPPNPNPTPQAHDLLFYSNVRVTNRSSRMLNKRGCSMLFLFLYILISLSVLFPLFDLIYILISFITVTHRKHFSASCPVHSRVYVYATQIKPEFDRIWFDFVPWLSALCLNGMVWNADVCVPALFTRHPLLFWFQGTHSTASVASSPQQLWAPH